MKKVYTTKNHVIYELTDKEKIKYENEYQNESDKYYLYSKEFYGKNKPCYSKDIGYQDWSCETLDECFEFSRPKKFMKVTPKFINSLINKYNKSIPFKKKELFNFYAKDKNKYICCFNIDGDCFIEEFIKIESVIKYFDTDLSVDDINNLEGYR